MIYIGLPQQSHPRRVRPGIASLEECAHHFNCMEGNTTLYALPKADIVARWQAQTVDAFRFCSKFPATISHQAALHNCNDPVQEFLTCMSPLESRTGQYWLQLPTTFSPRDLPALWQSLDVLPKPSIYGVEVRHPNFSAKGKAEQLPNRDLHECGMNRVILDGRPVYAVIPHTEATRSTQRKKLEVPVRAVMTTNRPMVRFIGSDGMARNSALFAVWLTELPLWQHTTTLYLFLHTSDIVQTLELVDTLWADLHNTLPEIGSAPSIPQQLSLF